jgi:flagellar assembly protein FliH
LQGLLTGLDAAAEAVESTLAAEVLDLALVISRQLVRREISADRTLVLDVIREAVATLPAAKAPARILLNADDLEVVAPLLATELHDDVWRFIADPSMEPGACRIESPSSSVDLTLASRWQSILRVLGRESAAGLDWADDLPDETDESPAP